MKTPDLVNRLRGIYVITVSDGAGTLDGKETFTRKFETPPIQHEAAAVIENALASLKNAVAMFYARRDVSFKSCGLSVPESEPVPDWVSNCEQAISAIENVKE